jgi:diacylglycerol kinase (ATP)
MTMDDRVEDAELVTKPAPVIGPARLLPAFRYACQGLAAAWRTEGAFRQEVLAALVLVPIAFSLPLPPLERALLVASVFLVMMVELLNSSLEAVVDRISLERHPLSKHAKDTGSAAVMMAIAIAALLWAVIVGGWLLRVG